MTGLWGLCSLWGPDSFIVAPERSRAGGARGGEGRGRGDRLLGEGEGEDGGEVGGVLLATFAGGAAQRAPPIPLPHPPPVRTSA